MNNAHCAAKLLEYADRCVAAYDAADPSAMKTALSESFHDFSRLKLELQMDNTATRKSVLDYMRNARPDIPVDTFIVKFAIPELVSIKAKEDNTRAAAVLQERKFSVNDTKASHETMKELARKLVATEIVNLRLAKLITKYNGALRINESRAGTRDHVPVRGDYCLSNHAITHIGGSKVKEGETTRPAYAKLCLFEDDLTTGLLDIVFEAPSQKIESVDKMNKTEFGMLMEQFEIKRSITPIAVPRFLPGHFRSLGARMIEVLFDSDVLVIDADYELLHRSV